MSLFTNDIDSRGVARLTLNRPEIHNAFNDELISGLTQEFKEMNSNESIRLVVITGAGRSFCAGADLNWMKAMVNYSEEQNYQDSMELANLFQTMDSFTKPIVGRVNGAALGGGSGLVAVCDHVIVSDDAKLGFTETRLGLVPAVISPYVIRKIGEGHARSLFLSGKRFSAIFSKEIGLCHEICKAEELDEKIERVVEEFLKASPFAQREAKALIFGLRECNNEQESKEFTCRKIAKMRVSKDGQEGMNALLEKRKPSWMEN